MTFENAERLAAYCWVNRGTTIASDSKWIRISAFRVSRLNIFRLSRSAARTLEALFPTTRPSARRPKADDWSVPGLTILVRNSSDERKDATQSDMRSRNCLTKQGFGTL